MNVRRWATEAPLIQELAVLVEDLHAVVGAVVDEYAPRARVDGDPVHIVEIAGPPIVRRRAFLAPGHDIFAGSVELHDPRVLVAVGDEERAVGQPRHERGPKEV